MTERARHVFTVKEYVTEDGESSPWVMLSLYESPDLSILADGFLGFDLKAGTTYEEAKALTETLNSIVTATTYTNPNAEAERIEREANDRDKRKREGRLN
ncbi:hypothetical protein [Mesorhizobium sp. WSM4313]|uniref:hypothetical protein n=1 Tax=Mesorhizobium sp. WSM4313 TaxID=2029412 RepID=UPI000BAFF37D|nr:hypothetical protein [Mesorhizobium sp. WSM4313]PBB19300.1 hypothetical protein CK219_14485 [Mesorhizobium sp. WSM4313]